MKKLLTQVDNAYFLPNIRIGNHVDLDIWFRNDWLFFKISPSSANDETYYCLNLYLGPVNISYTWIA